MKLERISEALRLYAKRHEASSGHEAFQVPHRDIRTKQKGSSVHGSVARRPQGKASSSDEQGKKLKLSLRRVLAWKINDRPTSCEIVPLHLTDPRYPAAQLAAGLRKYGDISPPRGTLTDEKLEYLMWRMLVLSVKQPCEDADPIDVEDTMSEAQTNVQAQVDLTSSDLQADAADVEVKTTESETEYRAPSSRPCAVRQTSSAAFSSTSQSCPSDAPSSLFANREETDSATSSSASSCARSDSPSCTAPMSVAMVRCVGELDGVVGQSDKSDSAQEWYNAVAFAHQAEMGKFRGHQQESGTVRLLSLLW